MASNHVGSSATTAASVDSGSLLPEDWNADCVVAYVGLGSNLSAGGQSPVDLVIAAFRCLSGLPGVRRVDASTLWQSAPQNAQGGPFTNAVAALSFSASAGPAAWPEVVLDGLQAIEQQFGRVREMDSEQRKAQGQPAAARCLDLDLLWHSAGDLISDRLVLPHPRALGRGFVLGPWAELAPDLCPFAGLGDPRPLRQLAAILAAAEPESSAMPRTLTQPALQTFTGA